MGQSEPPRKALGNKGEDHAWTLLQKRGDRLVTRNYTCPRGELDLVTWHGKTLVFTEVRLRSSIAFGTPAETVTHTKQQRVRRAAEWFLVEKLKGAKLPACRFDVVWILAKNGEIIESGIIEGAF